MNASIKQSLKKIGLYHPLQSAFRDSLSFLQRLRYKTSYRKYKGGGFECNFCGASYRRFVPEYPTADIEQAINSNKVIAGFGENVFFPNCLSKNRERLIKDVLDYYIDFAGKSILHFSPEKKLYQYVHSKARVTTIDLEPGFYKTIDPTIAQGDATQLHFPDEQFDIIIANHILEHIPDDEKAMKEIFRVLKRNGVAILQAPWSTNLPTTIEDRSIADPLQQAILFGQKDHVRIYTLPDYTSRLRRAGFTVNCIAPAELAQFQQHAIQEGEPVVLGYK